MPARNVVKIPIENGFYHIYNRGVNKQNIFNNHQDCAVFLNYLKESLSPPPKLEDLHKIQMNIYDNFFMRYEYRIKNFYNEIDLVAYALMPNHFHLLIRQAKPESMASFMQSIATRYSMYFNKVNDRVGSLFQGVYKAVPIENENYLLHLSRYIHLNPRGEFRDLTKAYSSYADYLGITKTQWLKPDPVLSFFKNPLNPEFKKINNYKDFVEKYKPETQKDENLLGGLILES